MNIDTSKVLEVANSFKDLYEDKGGKNYSEFNDGTRNGMDLIIGFITSYEYKEGERIARAMCKSKGEEGNNNGVV